MVYNDANRAFLQAFLARRILTYEEAEPILSAILTASGNPSPQVTSAIFQSFLNAANISLSPLDFQIRTLPSQEPPSPGANTNANPARRTTYYILTNTTSSPELQLATSHSAEEISFFRRLLDAMFETNNTPHLELCAVKSFEAIRLNRPRPGDQLDQPTQATQSSSAGLSMKDTEHALHTFVTEGWLDLSPGGWYTLSPRSLAELHRYLLDTYNLPDEEGDITERIKTCHGCKELLTIGQRCDNFDCGIRLHDVCAEGFWRVNRSRKCPACGGDWSGGKFVGERAARGVKQRVVATGSKKVSKGGRVSVASQISAAAANRRSARGQEDIEEQDSDRMEIE